MRYAVLLLSLLLGFGAAEAADVPQAGDVEINLGVADTRSAYMDSAYVSVGSAWLLDGGHQLGGSLDWEQTKVNDIDTESRGAAVLYRFNWITPEREFFPYAGVAYLRSEVRARYEYPGPDVLVTNIREAWQPHIGVKWMLNRYVAFDLRLSRYLEEFTSPFLKDSTVLFAGLSVFI